MGKFEGPDIDEPEPTPPPAEAEAAAAEEARRKKLAEKKKRSRRAQLLSKVSDEDALTAILGRPGARMPRGNVGRDDTRR